MLCLPSCPVWWIAVSFFLISNSGCNFILMIMQPSILPVQILRIGQLVILNVPGGIGICFVFVFFLSCSFNHSPVKVNGIKLKKPNVIDL